VFVVGKISRSNSSKGKRAYGDRDRHRQTESERVKQ